MRASDVAAALLLWFCARAAAVDSSTSQYDESPSNATAAMNPQLAAATLPELLARPLTVTPSHFDTQLQLASLQCRELGVFASTHGASAGNGDGSASAENQLALESAAVEVAMMGYCRKVRYVRLTRKKLRETLEAELARAEEEEEEERERLELEQQAGESDDESHSSPSARAPQEIEARAASSVELQEFFESFAETARPVVLGSGGEAEEKTMHVSDDHPLLGFTSADEWKAFLATCFAEPATKRSGRVAPLQVREDACAAHLERLRVPLFLVHDYIRRTNVSLSDTFLPSLVRVQPSWAVTPRPEAVVSCPLGLHMLALVLPDTSDDASRPSVGIQTFDQRLKPFLMEESGSPQVAEVVLSASSGGIVDPQSTSNSESARLPHIAPLYHKLDIAAGSFVFVPGSQFAVARPPTTATAANTSSDHQEETPATVSMLRFCFVDASNFNTVKQEVALEALVDDEAQTLLQSLQSHSFDRSMFRRPQPKDTLWSSFVTWPKETKLLKKSDLDSGDVQLSRRERLKQWQDDKRWDRHVEALTLPVSLPPVVVNATRTTATLRFQDLYETPKHDITAYGYIVRWRNIDEEVAFAAARQDRGASSAGSRDGAQEADAESNTLVHEPPSTNEMNVTRQHLVRSALPTTLFGDDFDGSDIEVVVYGLLAETRYSFSVQIYVDDTSGLESESSRIVQTAPCSEPSGVRGVPTAGGSDGACTTLRWLDPVDDGGKPVRLYLISARIVEGGRGPTDTAVAALAGSQDATRTTAANDEKVFTLNARFAAQQAGKKWKSAAVCTLVPGATYLFRVAAMNSIGVGPWSSTSDPVALPPSTSRHTQLGVGATSRRSASANTAIPTLKGRGDPDYVPMRAFSLRELTDLVVAHGPEVVIATVTEESAVDHQQHRQLSSGGSGIPKVILSDMQERLVVVEPTPAMDAEPLAIDVWSSHFSPRAFHVSSEIVRADPLDASAPLRNAEQVKDRVVLVTRGGAPFVFKTHYAQLAGALGVVIADVNDTCRGQFDQSCVPGGDKSRGEGFAAQDRHALWTQNRIPCVLVLHADAQRLMDLVRESG